MAVDSSSEPPLRVARIAHATTAEGPGLRTAIWVQGCSIRCPGCINPHLFTARGGTEILPSVIVREAEEHGVEGLTLLGGEPFDQAEVLAVLAARAHERGLGVVCFTGFTAAEAAGKPGGRALLENVDLLVDGPYVAAQPERSRALVGSTNQRFIHLTERYRDYEPERVPNRVDLRIGPDGEVAIAGFLTTEGLGELAALLETRRSRPRPRRRSSDPR